MESNTGDDNETAGTSSTSSRTAKRRARYGRNEFFEGSESEVGGEGEQVGPPSVETEVTG